MCVNTWYITYLHLVKTMCLTKLIVLSHTHILLIGPLLIVSLNWYLLMAQPHLWCKCFVLLYFFYILALGECSRWFWGSKDSIFVHSSIVHEHWGASPFLFRTLALDLFDCLSSLWRCLEWLHLICNLWSSI